MDRPDSSATVAHWGYGRWMGGDEFFIADMNGTIMVRGLDEEKAKLIVEAVNARLG